YAYLLVGGISLVLVAGCLLLSSTFRRRPVPIPLLEPGRWGGPQVVFALAIHQAMLLLVLGTLALLDPSLPDMPPDAIKVELGRLQIRGSPLTAALTLAL